MSGLSPTADRMLCSEEQSFLESQAMIALARRLMLLVDLLMQLQALVLLAAFLSFFFVDGGLDDRDPKVMLVTAAASVTEEAAVGVAMLVASTSDKEKIV